MTRRLPVLPLAVSLLLLSPVAFAAVRPHHRASTHAIVRRSTSTHAMHAAHVVEHASYASIDADRATQIQAALIQRGYLTGEPAGTWDSASVAAMQKLQSDNGWQTKFVPDSRALIKLGLGPGSTPAPVTTPGTGASATTPTTQSMAADQTF